MMNCALMNPADYEGEGGSVAQPPYDARKPHNHYPEEVYSTMLATPDEVIVSLGKMVRAAGK